MGEVVVAAVDNDVGSRPKSKKELRAEKKAAKRKAASQDQVELASSQPQLSADEAKKAEKYRLKKELRKHKLKEREREMIKEMRREKKIRQQKRKRRELHAVGGGLTNPMETAQRLELRRNKKKQKKEQQNVQGTSLELAVFDKVFNGVGAEEDESGAKTLELGVKAIDVVIGKGQVVQNNSLVTVRYKLKGGKFNTVIDSSKKFIFRVGKGEVIQGWEVGVQGMAVGGTRKLVVPPKAGYGGKDIGAGPGALLYFDITVLACS